MLKVKVKAKDKKFSIPVPYVLLNVAGLIVTSKRMNRFINKAIEKDGSKFVFPEIDRKDLKQLLEVISDYRGVTLVDTKLKDGTEVVVRL
ncbi:hypothetical protein [Bacillus infantis]|uniref:hypothetical protein n=1 Tax=Bacillus infantis TaxID=324767 RepID=UPI002E8BB65A|nr:hypothetical protein [Bacillus infantis]